MCNPAENDSRGNMKNYDIFSSKIAFYFGMGIVGSIAIAAIAAALFETSFASAFAEIQQLLGHLSGLAEEGAALKIVGIPVAMLVLSLTAYAFDYAGDMTLPAISSRFRDFGNPRARWSRSELNGDWRESKRIYRDVNDIGGDRRKWESAKARLGKTSVRVFRTTFYIVALTLIAGIIDIVAGGNYANRGISLVVISLIALPLCVALWAARHEKYVENLMESFDPNTLPESYKDALKAR